MVCFPPHGCTHVRGLPLELHILQQIFGVFVYSSGILLPPPPPKRPYRARRASTARGVARQAASSKVSC